jgi:TonB-dependent SusC/RagA subfamily outer membrane receptor
MRRHLRYTALLLIAPIALGAQAIPGDTSRHTQRFINVEPTVKLEVLDWGGTGRPLVLLAGNGNTAHVFDDLAPKLAQRYRVFGITRRGFGNSSAPAWGYLSDSLADDVLAVMDSLHIRRPILVGHSLAGQELSSIGSRHPERVAGLVYLEAGYGHAFYDSAQTRVGLTMFDVQRKLARLDDPGSVLTLAERDTIVRELLSTSLPLMERDLRVYDRAVAAAPDKSIVAPAPEHDQIQRALTLGMQKYTAVRAPVLAFFALPGEAPPEIAKDSASRARFDSSYIAARAPQVNAFSRGIPSARVVTIAHANHYIFRSNEAEVLRQMFDFIDGLPPRTVAEQISPGRCDQVPPALMYVVDGKESTCIAVTALPVDRIASVDVLKGAAAVAQYGVSAGAGVIIIRTSRDR